MDFLNLSNFFVWDNLGPNGKIREIGNPIYQKQLNGKFLIKSITHNFAGQGQSNVNYTQRIVVLKNAYQGSESDNLINIPKENQNISELTTQKERIIAKP